MLRCVGLIFAAMGALVSPDSLAGGMVPVSLFIQNQGVTVTGTVTSENGDPLPGVSVIEKGTSNGTVTDTEGRYSFSVSSASATLVFSFIGYANREMPLNGRTTVDVSLSEDVVALGEVVVVGYGTQRKTDLTGAVSLYPRLRSGNSRWLA